MAAKSKKAPKPLSRKVYKKPSSFLRIVLFCLVAALIAAAIILPIYRFLFGLMGSMLAERYRTLLFDTIFYFGAWLIMAFFIGVILGWFTNKKPLLVGAGTAFLTIIIESLSRYVRFGGKVSLASIFNAVISPKLFLYNYLLLTLGLILGVWVGKKAFEENHKIRLIIFAAFLLLLIITAQLYYLQHGLIIWNPFSKFRGIE